MTTAEAIFAEVRSLPDDVQTEVLDFVEFLRLRHGEEDGPEPDWSRVSLISAMRGMESEESPEYTESDLKEVF